MAATPDGGGYWLAEANGTVFNFGDALALAQLSPVKAASPVVGLTVTPDGTGAWIAEQNGTVLTLAPRPPTVRYRACAPPHWSPRSPQY